MPRIRTVLTAGAAVVLAVTLSGCSGGGGDVALGETARVELREGTQPFDVTVTAVREAPADVQDSVEGDETISFADVQITYAGTEPMTAHEILSSVYAKLSDGSFLEVYISGLDECGLDGTTEDVVDQLAAGETISLCQPLSGDGDDTLVGVYVGPDDVNDSGGKVWKAE